MAKKTTKFHVPKSGLEGLKNNWRNDLIAAFSVAMVAIPLGLGIAQASDVPPMAGIISAIIGGLVTTFIRGSHLGINGPTAGLITVVAGATISLNDGTGNTLNYIFAAVVIAGAIQVLLGLFKLGRVGEILPSSVINGVLAAIGVIIMVNQIDDVLGFVYSPEAKSIPQKLGELPTRILDLNPLITLLGIVSVGFLVLYPRMKNHLVRFIPSPMWVLVIGVSFVLALGISSPTTFNVFGQTLEAGPEYLISLPDNLAGMIMFPNFGKIGDPVFWVIVLSMVLIASIESLASSKAVDKLDPYKRSTNLNKDLIGIGISTMLAGMIGGLPIITVIARSSVNVNNRARTRWSNFFHGAIVAIFVLALAPVMQKVPLAVLGAILVYTGFKLAGPKIFKQTSMLGWEQVLFLAITLISALVYNILLGLLIGVITTLLYHLIVSRLNLVGFFKYISRPSIRVIPNEAGEHRIKIRGLANFLTLISIQKVFKDAPEKAKIVVDLSQARLIDLTVMEYIHDFSSKYKQKGGEFLITGDKLHDATSNHPIALRTLHTTRRKPLTKRQVQLKKIALNNNWSYQNDIKWDNSYLKNFHFFETRPIEYKENVISGKYEELNCEWEIADITFDEGALVAAEVYHSTIETLRLPFNIPKFTLEKEDKMDKIFDHVMKFAGYVDIDFKLFPNFSDQFLLEGPNEDEIREFFTKDLITFLEQNEIYHVESNGEALLIFRRLRVAKSEEIFKLLEFCGQLVEKLKPKKEISG